MLKSTDIEDSRNVAEGHARREQWEHLADPSPSLEKQHAGWL